MRSILLALVAFAIAVGFAPTASATNWTNPTCTDGWGTSGSLHYCAGAEFDTVQNYGRMWYQNGVPWYEGSTECYVNVGPFGQNGCNWDVWNYSEWVTNDDGATWNHMYAWSTNNYYTNGTGCCGTWTNFPSSGNSYPITSDGFIVGYTTSQVLRDYFDGWGCGTQIWIDTRANNSYDSGIAGC